MSERDGAAAGTGERSGDAPIRGEVREAGYRRLSHGLYLRLQPGLDSDQEFVRDLIAWQMVLPPMALFTHITGARLLGWQLPKLPEQVPIFAAVEGDTNRPRRSGLICSRLVRETCRRDRHEPPVESAEEILLRASRDFGTLDMGILTDSARRSGDVDSERMDAVLSSHRPGVRMLRSAWSLSDARSESGGETILRRFHETMDVGVEPQAKLYDAHGNLIGHADLLIRGTNFVQEYDGAVHRDGRQHSTDLRRERGLVGTSYERRGYTLDDLLNHPIVVMHELDRILDRPHRMVRLNRWRRLVENSLYSRAGRERVFNRWRRLNGIIDWSRTA